ncbi:trypsin-like peptidase domain-containing protein [bacterium]|nr:trypsin-like peptidase domain-containing protein [bacterium]
MTMSRGAALPLLVAVAAVASALALPLRARGDAEAERDLALARAAETRVQAAIARVRDAVVTIGAEVRAPRTDETSELKPVVSGGSGVIISQDGYVLTNDHVTIGAPRVQVGLRDGRMLDGVVTGRDRTGDLAVVKVSASGLPWAPLGDSGKLKEGQLVLALGNPFALAKEDHEPSATLGIVSGLHRYQGGEKVYGDAIQIDAAVNPGNSGGPLFDLDGKVVGVTGRISIRANEKRNVGVGFAVPIDQVKRILPALESGAEVVHGYLGVKFREEAEGDGRAGVVIAAVLPGTPADHAGLKKGDRILRVDGTEVDQPVRLENLLSVLPAGVTITLEVERDGRTIEARTTLGRKHP